MANPFPVSISNPRFEGPDDSSRDSMKHSSEELPATAPASLPPAGPRKLVRPTLPARALGSKNFFPRKDHIALAHHEVMTSGHNGHENSHAEAFYFQKQAQSKTPMVFILEDGERIEGYIEWYDHNVIKVRNHSRTLIYKSSIKYLFKANEHQTHL
jgi:sRNA-binding regulator protein Hfq